MNRQQRETYANNSLRVQKAMEKRFIGSIYKALRAQISSFTANARVMGTLQALNRLDVIDPQMAKVVERIYREAGTFAARRTKKTLAGGTPNIRGSSRRGGKRANSPSLQFKAEEEIVPFDVLAAICRPKQEIKAGGGLRGGSKVTDSTSLQFKRGGFGFNERMTADIMEYFRLHLLEKAVLPISATTRERIETVLRQGVREGWGVDRILKELEGDTFREMTRRRAETIVRTEVVRATNYGALAAANDSEFEQTKLWIAIDDTRTRRSHNHVDNERRDLLDPFSNGLQFPGDPGGPPEETINCRCTIAFRAKRDARGRLIPKKEPGIVVSLATRLTALYRRIAAFLNL